MLLSILILTGCWMLLRWALKSNGDGYFFKF